MGRPPGPVLLLLPLLLLLLLLRVRLTQAACLQSPGPRLGAPRLTVSFAYPAERRQMRVGGGPARRCCWGGPPSLWRFPVPRGPPSSAAHTPRGPPAAVSVGLEEQAASQQAWRRQQQQQQQQQPHAVRGCRCSGSRLLASRRLGSRCVPRGPPSNQCSGGPHSARARAAGSPLPLGFAAASAPRSLRRPVYEDLSRGLAGGPRFASIAASRGPWGPSKDTCREAPQGAPATALEEACGAPDVGDSEGPAFPSSFTAATEIIERAEGSHEGPQGGPLRAGAPQQGPPRRFAVVDGSCVMFRCYHAMPVLRNREGDNVGAIRRVLSPSHLAVVFDHPTGRSSRLAISETYKSHRTHPPLDLREQLQKAKFLCAAMGLSPLEVEGVEGDDVIATLRRRPLVRVLALHRQFQLVDESFVRAQFGVAPHQLLDFFCLVGDRADGIVGCRGIGMAAARKLLQAVESLEAFRAAPQSMETASLRSRQQSSLLAFLPQWEVNRQLVALNCSVPAARAASLTAFRLRPLGIDRLRELFAPYNLAKHAELWNQPAAAGAGGQPAGAAAATTTAAATPAAAAAATAQAAPAYATAATAAARAAAAGGSGGAAEQQPQVTQTPKPAAAAAQAGGELLASSSPSPPASSSSCAVSHSAAASGVAAGAAAAAGGDAAAHAATMHLAATAEAAAGSAAVTQSAAGDPEAAQAPSSSSSSSISSGSSSSSNSGSWIDTWNPLASMLPAVWGPSLLLEAQGAPLDSASGRLHPPWPRRRQLPLLLTPQAVSQRRCLNDLTLEKEHAMLVAAPAPAATTPARTAAATAAATAAEGAPSSTHVEPSWAKQVAASTAAGNSIPCSSSWCSSPPAAALEGVLARQQCVPLQDRYAAALREGSSSWPSSSSDDQSSNISSSSKIDPADSASPAGVSSSALLLPDSEGRISSLLLQEGRHVAALQRHLQQMQQAAAAVAAAAAAASAAAATTLKAARVRASRAAARRHGTAAAAACHAAAASPAEHSAAAGGQAAAAAEKKQCPGDTAAAAAGAVAAADDGLPLVPPIECGGSVASPSPLSQAEALHSTLVLCLRYLSLLQAQTGSSSNNSSSSSSSSSRNSNSSSSSTHGSSHMTTHTAADDLVRQLPEPVPLNALEMSLAAMNSRDGSSSGSINSSSSSSSSSDGTLSANSSTSMRCNSHSSSKRGGNLCSALHSGCLLLPVAVSWLAASPGGPHAPACASRPLHLTFSLRLPRGLLQCILRLQQQQLLQQQQISVEDDIVHFHFEVSRLLQDAAAVRLLRGCLRARSLHDLCAFSSVHTPGEQQQEAAELRGSPRVLWSAHDAKQLLHLLLNAQLPPPETHQLHCTSVMAWLLHGADPKTSDLLQHATLYSILQHQQQPSDKAAAAAAPAADREIGGFPEEAAQELALAESQWPQEETAAAERGGPDPVLQLLESPFALLIVDCMTAAAAAGVACAAAAAAPATPGSAAPAAAGLSSSSRSVQTPWRSAALARLHLLPPEQQQLQQGLFGRYGWGIYSKLPLKGAKAAALTLKESSSSSSRSRSSGSSTSNSSSSCSIAAEASPLRLSFQPVVAAPAAHNAAPGKAGDSACEETAISRQQRLDSDVLNKGSSSLETASIHSSTGSSSTGSSNSSSSSSVRFPHRFKRCCPPRPPELLDSLDIQAFCEARSTATLLLVEEQQQQLQQQQQQQLQLQQQQQQPAEARLVGIEETGCLSLTWGVWAQIERPLIPALVALERRGLSLSTPILTASWRAQRGGTSQPTAEETQETASEATLAAAAASRPAAASAAAASACKELMPARKLAPGGLETARDCSEALHAQRQLQEQIWEQIKQLTGSAANININSPSQLATLLFDVLQLPFPSSAFSAAAAAGKEAQLMRRRNSSSSSKGSRSTGAEALQALLRDAKCREGDSRSAQVAALLTALLEYRKSQKFVSTYLTSLPDFIFPPSHRIHVSLLQTGASTGRLACRSPNLQNIPNHHDEWRWIRRAFIPGAVEPHRSQLGDSCCGDLITAACVPPSGGETPTAAVAAAAAAAGAAAAKQPAAAAAAPPPAAPARAAVAKQPTAAAAAGAATEVSPWRFVSVDYSQMELHILAYLANDLQLLQDLRGGDDPSPAPRKFDTFQLTASRLFGCPPEEVTKERRSAAKTVTYGILYGQTEGGLSRQLQVPLKDARRLIDCFFNEYRGVQTLTQTHTQFAAATGTAQTLVGRTRRLEAADALSVHPNLHKQLAALTRSIGIARKPEQQQSPITSSSSSSGRGGAKGRCRRQAMNTPIQGLAADIMKYATARVEQLLQQQQQRAFAYEQQQQQQQDGGDPGVPHRALRRALRAQVVLQIHDELLLEVHKDDVSLTLELVVPLMQRAWGSILVETGCLDRYAALCRVQRRLTDSSCQLDSGSEEEAAALHAWALRAAAGPRGNRCPPEPDWFALFPQYEWLRPLLQRVLPTKATVGTDWACC
ncbi:hypothetical protein Efla_005036 [Eimeria flavescens]